MRAFADLVADGLVERDVPLDGFTTYRVGGPAQWYYAAADPEALRVVVPAEVPVLVLGRGSNVVVASAGFPGLVIHLQPSTAGLSIEGFEVDAPGGLPLPLLARRAAEAGIGGLTSFVGIPGSVGGAVAMNAGCHGSETRDVLVEAETWDLRTGSASRRTPTELEMAYRSTALTSDEVVLRARFRGEVSTPEAEESVMREVSRWRRDHQPGGTFNAGSVFKNPDGDAAGRIIDEAGLKGLRRGGARVSERHANFIEADPTATPEDIRDLTEEVRARVEAEVGVRLVPEIRFVGFE